MPSNRRSGDTGSGLAGFGLGGSRPPPGPRARFSPWRALVLATVIVIGGIYAAPNLFPPDFALQVTVDNSPRTFDDGLLEELAEVLEAGGVPVIAKERTAEGGLLRVGDAEAQLRGSALLRDHLNPPGEERQFVVALNLASTTPEWLRGIGAEPMALGLDLKGGANFVLQVDMEAALAKRLTDEVEKIKDMLREERVRYRSTANAVQGETIRMGFATAQLRDRAYADHRGRVPRA